MSAAPREFCLVGNSAIRAVRQALESALCAWASDWLAQDDGAPRSDLQVAAFPAAAGLPQAFARDCMSWDDAHLWLAESAAQADRLGRAIAGASWRDGADDPWLATLLARAREARDRAVCAALAGRAELQPSRSTQVDVPPAICRSGSGAIRLLCPRLGLDAIADLPAWRTHLARAPRPDDVPLAPRQPLAAVAGRGVLRLVASLGSVRLDASTAFDLRRGDVLRLDRGLDDGVDLACDGVPVCRADLGQVGGRLGLQLRPHTNLE